MLQFLTKNPHLSLRMTPLCTHMLLVNDELLLTVSTGRQALQAVAEVASTSMGLVILDTSLLAMDGGDLLQRLQERDDPALGHGC